MRKKQSQNPYDVLDIFDDKNVKEGITEEEKKRLTNELTKFNEWLILTKVISEKFDIENVKIEPFSTEDWTMRVYSEDNKQIVSFNPNIIKKCEYDYLEMVLLHEYFHLIVQKVPNKEDALKIKDTFGTDFMSLIDIEADFYVALYLKNEKKISMENYWELYFKGANIFLDKWIRTKKFERFLGSLLTVNKMFLEKSPSFDLFLPTISPIYTEESIMILVIKEKHIVFQEIFAEYGDFKELKSLYKTPNDFKFEDYYEKIIQFTNKALNLKKI